MNVKHQIASGIAWRFMERIGVRLMHFLVTLILARLLTPEAFGTVAILMIFISLSKIFVDGGFGCALVQRKNITQTDCSTVFFLNCVISMLIYMVLFLTAPLVARFYNSASLVWLLRVLSISLILNALNVVQDAVLRRNMRFDLSFRIGLTETVGTGILGCLFAFMGYGAWALVIGTVGGQVIGTVVRWEIVHWRPQLLFSMRSAIGMFDFGWKVLLTSFLNTSYTSLSGLVIGKTFSVSELAFYNRGYSVSNLLMESINGTIGSVAFPGLANVQDDLQSFLDIMRNMIRVSIFVVAPLMVGLSVCADSIVPILFGSQWLEIIPYVRVFSLMFVFFPITSVMFQSLLAHGRSDLSFGLEVIKNVLGITILFISTGRTPLFLAVAIAIVYAPIGLLINFLPNRRLSGYSAKMLFGDVSSPILLSTIMGILISFLTFFMNTGFLLLLLQIISGGLIYLTMAYVFRVQAFQTLNRTIKKLSSSFIKRINA